MNLREFTKPLIEIGWEVVAEERRYRKRRIGDPGIYPSIRLEKRVDDETKSLAVYYRDGNPNDLYPACREPHYQATFRSSNSVGGVETRFDEYGVDIDGNADFLRFLLIGDETEKSILKRRRLLYNILSEGFSERKKAPYVVLKTQ